MRRHHAASTLPMATEAEAEAEAGKTEEQKLTAVFQAAQTERSANIMLSMAPYVLATWTVVLLNNWMTGNVDLLTVLQSSSRIIIQFVVVLLKPYAQKKIKEHPIFIASAIQCVAHVIAVLECVELACKVPEPIKQHRVFLTSFLAIHAFTAANLHVPMSVFVAFVCPVYLAGWLRFHAAVDFLTMTCIWYFLWLSAAAIYIRHYHAGVAWREFQANQALHQERLLVQAKQESFQNILSSIFDASCTCEQSGALTEISPHLQELLNIARPHADGVPSADGAHEGLSLCHFTATDAESARLGSFLASASSYARHQASKIQCSFRRGSQEIVEACLYASILDDCSYRHGGRELLFIVFQIQAVRSAAVISADDVCNSSPRGKEDASSQLGEDVLLSSLPLQAFENTNPCLFEENLSKDSRVSPMPDLAQDDDDNSLLSGSLSYSKAQSTVAGRGLDSISVRQNLSVDAATQTSARPPPRAVDRDEAFAASRRALGKHVRLNTSRRVLRRFAETPTSTLQVLVNVWMASINSCGRGCCAYHVTAARLMQYVKTMRQRPCNHAFHLNSGWQCSFCFAVNDYDSDDDIHECGICERPKDQTEERLDSAEDATDEREEDRLMVT